MRLSENIDIRTRRMRRLTETLPQSDVPSRRWMGVPLCARLRSFLPS